ncbi:muts domain V-domain-containing protein [Stachybotrys elegans]|uniref:DNA mismatch repair protein MSH3 n=1 Tax=Stachybotrys elegans TaxID=80388 RepID=A0A8K0SMI9_9HYPO|nr:muts domain V-domain-containing protein [Stachybotrys elegans]
MHRTGSSVPSRTMSRASSVYFQNDQASSTPLPSSERISSDDSRPYTSLSSSTRTSVGPPRPPTSRPGTRPGTASGRKSRATTASSVLGISDAQNVVCAVSEARGVSPSVGVAFVDVSHGDVVLSQICDTQSYIKTIHKIQIACPSRIIFMATACPPHRPSVLYTLVNDMVETAQVLAFDRSAWSETAGLEYIQDHAFENDIESIKVAISGKFYATSSFAAVMKYIDHHYGIRFAPHSLRIRYQPSEDTMMIDISAIQSLEIMQNLHNPKSKDSLFGLLNHTLTPMGSRMLRSNMLQPSTIKDSFMERRYDAVGELTSNEEMFMQVRKALKLFHDVEKLLTKLIIISSGTDVGHVEEQISQILMIKSFLETVPDLYGALGPAESKLLDKIRDHCRPDITEPILHTIGRNIEPDVTYMRSPLDLRNQRTFAVRAGVSSILDIARQTYKELTEEVHQHVDDINGLGTQPTSKAVAYTVLGAHGLGASLKFDNGRKYWLRIKSGNLSDEHLPAVFINVIKKKDNIECQTLDLVKLNMRLSDAYNEVVIRSDNVIQDLTAALRAEAPRLFVVCESVGLLDMIASFAQLTSTRDYVRPEITGTLAIQAARHPILDKTMATSFVPNDYYSTERYCYNIITGCNMSGKSTYIRTAALLQIMAQIGCFVPAQYASFSVVHSIFARVSLDDNIEANLSTFSVEMREMAFILRNVDKKSMVIIDELGRGTSTRDGLAIAIAMSEALIQTQASVWFATHFLELARVLDGRPGVLNLHLASTTSTTQDGLPHITMLYKVAARSINDDQHYGIDLARAMGLPASFISRAEEVAKALREGRKAKQQNSESRKLMVRRSLILTLYDSLRQARDSGSEASLPGYLRRLQEEFILRMEALGNQ